MAKFDTDRLVTASTSAASMAKDANAAWDTMIADRNRAVDAIRTYNASLESVKEKFAATTQQIGSVTTIASELTGAEVTFPEPIPEPAGGVDESVATARRR